jgi:hypothetical protein
MDPNPDWIGIELVRESGPNAGRQNYLQKQKKGKKIRVSKWWMVSFRVLEASPVA